MRFNVSFNACMYVAIYFMYRDFPAPIQILWAGTVLGVPRSLFCIVRHHHAAMVGLQEEIGIAKGNINA
jgi:hypothetical protein